MNTPKFANSFTSATPPVQDLEQPTIIDSNNIFQHTEVKEKEKKTIQTQIDDFPKLIDQMK